MAKIINYVGIDMAKVSFMAAAREDLEPKQFNSISQGISSFFKYLTRLNFSKDETLIGVESTGSYHLKLCLTCQEKGCPIKVINPLIVKKHNQTSLRRVKNDVRDACLIR